jgi:hypothetical protein
MKAVDTNQQNSVPSGQFPGAQQQLTGCRKRSSRRSLEVMYQGPQHGRLKSHGVERILDWHINLQEKQIISDLLCPDIQRCLQATAGSSKPTCTSDFDSLASSGVAKAVNATKSTLEDTRFWVISSDAGPQRQLALIWPDPAFSAACVQSSHRQNWKWYVCFAVHRDKQAHVA